MNMFLYTNNDLSIDKIFGTLSAQRIFFTLATWENLAVTDIITKTKLSESQIHQTLKKLSDIHMIEKVSRGVYALSKNSATEYLKKFYSHLLIEHVGSELYKLSKSVDTQPIEDVSTQLNELLLQWRPLMEEHYSHRLSSLVESILDKSVYERNVINE